MGRLFKEIKSVSGAMVTLLVLLIGLFFVLNWLANNAPAPISTGASWAASHASSGGYGGGGVAPAATTNVSYMGPLV